MKETRISQSSASAALHASNAPVSLPVGAGQVLQNAAWSSMKTKTISLLLAAALALVAFPSFAGQSGIVNASGLVTVHNGDGFALSVVIAGDPGSAHLLLIRAAGRALQSLGVGDFLPDPTLTLYKTENGQSSPVAIFPFQTADAEFYSTAVGAFPIEKGQAEEGNVVILVSLEPGIYSVAVGSKAGKSGRVLAEIYTIDDADIIRLPSPTVTGSSSVSVGDVAEFTVTRLVDGLGESFRVTFDDDPGVFTKSSLETTFKVQHLWATAGEHSVTASTYQPATGHSSLPVTFAVEVR